MRAGSLPSSRSRRERIGNGSIHRQILELFLTEVVDHFRGSILGTHFSIDIRAIEAPLGLDGRENGHRFRLAVIFLSILVNSSESSS